MTTLVNAPAIASARPTRPTPVPRWAPSRRAVRISVGAMWLVAGALQLQSFMFTRAFSDDVLGSAAVSQPTPLAQVIRFSQRLVGHDPVGWNWLFAATELLIGLGLILGRTGRLARIACVASLGWGASVWLLGEGAGGLLTGHAALSTGAPGAALIYLGLTLAAWPTPTAPDGRELPVSRRIGAGLWLFVWLSGAVLSMLPGQWGVSGLSAQASMGWMMAPSWAVGPTLAVTHWLAALPVGAAIALSLLVVAVQVAAASAVLRSGRTRRVLLAFGAALALVGWMFGQGFGGLSTGTATDVGSGPLLLILALAVWTSPTDR